MPVVNEFDIPDAMIPTSSAGSVPKVNIRAYA